MLKTTIFLKASFISAAVIVAGLPFSISSAVSADYIVKTPPLYTQNADLCSEQSILKRVTSGFSYQNRHITALPRNNINAVSNIVLTRYEPPKYKPQITRTYCQATAHLNNNEQRQLYYMIEDGQGFASIGRNVEFCVDGYDIWHVYDAGCRVLK